MHYLVLSFLYILNFTPAHGECLNNKKGLQADIVGVLLEQAVTCPQDVQDLKKILEEDGLNTLPAMVANRGAHNPVKGSFSLFESVTGSSASLKKMILPEHFYFGHFTTLDSDNNLMLDQTSFPNKLLIEVIAYDFKKEVYNFYELVGTNSGPKWFYRGDSFDIYEDNKNLKVQNDSGFGSRLRCSACHSSGGPIMKELAPPHNDWWIEENKLSFGSNDLSQELKGYVSKFIDASVFSQNVQKGMVLLEKKKILFSRNMKEKLRPLFCTTEINLVSDLLPLSSPSKLISIPSEVFVDPLLAGDETLSMPKEYYVRALKDLKSQFPETELLDADHAFLVPVRSVINHLHVKQLISEGLIDEEFALDVLSIDFKNPMFSKSRCGLLKFLPEGNNWKEEFKMNLYGANTKVEIEIAQKLETNNKNEHRLLAKNHLREKQAEWMDAESVKSEVIFLNNLRTSVFNDAISKNPKGQILEPGFRVIFPLFKGKI